MASAGRILIMPKGAYDSSTTYEMLDMVSYNGTTWLAKKTVKGVEPSDANSEYWHNMVSMDAGDYLKITGGVLTGSTKIERNVDGVVVATELFPSNYDIYDEKVSSFVHFRNGVAKALLGFNEYGVGYRDNEKGVFHHLFGEHNIDLLKPHIEEIIAEYLNNNS